MTTDGWEQRLDDLGQARDLREAMWSTVAEVRDRAPRRHDDADSYDVVDALLSGPLAPLLASIERVEALAERFGWDTMPEPDWTGRQVSEAIRSALDGETPE